MAQVPYTPAATAEPTVGGERLQVNAPAAAFGVNIAQAVEGLGAEGEKVGDELFTRAMALQELRNEADAREAQSNYAQQASLLHAQYGALEGKAAADALPGYIKSQNDLRMQLRGALKTQIAQKLYDADTLPFMQRNVFSAAGHAADQNKNYVIGTAQAQKDIANRTFVDPKSDEEFAHKLSAVRSADDTIIGAQRVDENSPIAQDMHLKSAQQLWASRIMQIADTDPPTALKMVDRHKVDLGDNYEKVLEIATTKNHAIGSRVIADNVLADLIHGDPTAKRPDRPLQSYLDDGDKAAQATSPNDPTMQDYVRARITSLYNNHNASVRDFKYQNENTIAGALIGGDNGMRPTTPEQLTAMGPKYEEAWNALDDIAKQRMLKSMASMSKGDVAWTVDNLRRYQQLKGMALNDPSGFLNANVVDEKIPFYARKELINLQNSIINRGEQDPRVPRAMQILAPGLPQSLLEDKDEKQQFMGALSDTLRDFQEEHKRPPNAEETKEMGQRLLQQQVTQRGFIRDSKGPLYNLPIPQKDIDDQREKLEAKTGLVIGDEQVRREIIRQQYKKLYGGSAKGSIVGKPGEEINSGE